jgi:DNA helicase-2/ATP-dependent DNA helicase PcrA
VLLKKLGKYEILQWLGGGRFGDVFLARDTILDKEFALKVSRMRKEEISMLKDEAKLLASLNHPNIVRFYNIDFIDNKFVLVMEYIKGQILRDIITQGGIAISEVVNIAMQILNAVYYAHSQQVLHRDLKPENILITKKENTNIVKVTDFGLARFIKSGSISASTAGTPVYMAPEAWSGNFNEKSDIWSIGVIFYELLTGTLPFLDDSLNGLKNKIDNNTFLVPTMLRPDIPEYIEDVVLKSLKRDPRARPVAHELLDKLDERGREIKIKQGIKIPAQEIKTINLTPTQREVIESQSDRVLLLGKAGCGKTTTLTYAIARLLEKGIPVSKILICTFTNKAANDIKYRLQKCAHFSPYELWLGTFHTLGLRMLRRDIERINISEDFTIDEPKNIFKEMKLKTGEYRSNAVIKFIEILKAKTLTPRYSDPQNKWESFCYKIYEQYEQYKRENSILDYDDLILYAITLLEENHDIQEYYKNLFEYIFVDELQDINPAQYKLLSLLYKNHIFFTGDEDQAIYGWRGADKELIYRVAKDYEDVKIFLLTTSFRLPPNILNIANNLMKREAIVIPAKHDGDVVVYAAKSEQDEADYIVKEIKRLRKNSFMFQNIALLYRMNYISRVYEDTLARNRIPHTIIGGSSFYARADIKPLVEYLELLEASHTIKKDECVARAMGLFKIKKKEHARAQKIFQYHMENAHLLSPAVIIDQVTGVTHLKGGNLEELESLARSHTNISLSQFLNEVKLIQELDLIDWGKDTVKLITVHGAKGLEFPVVFIVDLVENIFPMTKKISSQKDIEEERRLCYVALTRSQNKLYLLYPKWRYGRYQQPSRFLADMFKTSSL